MKVVVTCGAKVRDTCSTAEAGTRGTVPWVGPRGKLPCASGACKYPAQNRRWAVHVSMGGDDRLEGGGVLGAAEGEGVVVGLSDEGVPREEAADALKVEDEKGEAVAVVWLRHSVRRGGGGVEQRVPMTQPLAGGAVHCVIVLKRSACGRVLGHGAADFDLAACLPCADPEIRFSYLRPSRGAPGGARAARAESIKVLGKEAEQHRAFPRGPLLATVRRHSDRPWRAHTLSSSLELCPSDSTLRQPLPYPQLL